MMRLREVRTHVYWHASDKTKLKKLEPIYSALVDREVVFAATYPEVAVAMAFHWNDDDFKFGRSMRKGTDPKSVPYTLKELYHGAFEDFFSQPVSLYEVEGKFFKDDPNIQDFEVVSNKMVEVLEEHRIDHPLDYLHNSRMVKLKSFKND
jgi:hypothetical protein